MMQNIATIVDQMSIDLRYHIINSPTVWRPGADLYVSRRIVQNDAFEAARRMAGKADLECVIEASVLLGAAFMHAYMTLDHGRLLLPGALQAAANRLADVRDRPIDAALYAAAVEACLAKADRQYGNDELGGWMSAASNGYMNFAIDRVRHSLASAGDGFVYQPACSDLVLYVVDGSASSLAEARRHSDDKMLIVGRTLPRSGDPMTTERFLDRDALRHKMPTASIAEIAPSDDSQQAAVTILPAASESSTPAPTDRIDDDQIPSTAAAPPSFEHDARSSPTAAVQTDEWPSTPPVLPAPPTSAAPVAASGKASSPRQARLKSNDVPGVIAHFCEVASKPVAQGGAGLSKTNAAEAPNLIKAFVEQMRVTDLKHLTGALVIAYFEAHSGDWSKRSAYRHHKALEPFTEWCHRQKLAGAMNWSAIGNVIGTLWP